MAIIIDTYFLTFSKKIDMKVGFDFMDVMSIRLFPHIYASDNTTIKSSTNKSLLLQQDLNLSNNSTKILFSKY